MEFTSLNLQHHKDSLTSEQNCYDCVAGLVEKKTRAPSDNATVIAVHLHLAVSLNTWEFLSLSGSSAEKEDQKQV